ncbi:Bcyrb2 [Botrytis cinerea B05.10]|uniref:Bcyrb2 n=1 Tax=Botryotinia fuckeliana (strain B05.10) TaxID=332648 RepID=A0A384JDS5_BOTFB|nr:Bcyrb2 [Botrytis cinerea B05.10]ATZ48632.1 Bcyrb2 [Botrytis cinerea B05.10]
MATSSNAGADPASASFEIRDHSKSDNHKSDIIEENHNSPAPTSTDGGNGDSQKDDAATMAASEELKHTSISDKLPLPTETPSQMPQTEAQTEDKDMSGTDKDTTPEAEPIDAQDEEMRDRVSSPKKKRGRDQDDDTNQAEDESGRNNGVASEGSLNGSRTMRSGPEKKRPRDTSQEPSRISDKVLAKERSQNEASKIAETSTSSTENPIKSTFGSTSGDKFASSGFGALASASTSPFGTIGASKPSVFGSGAKSPLPGFGSFASAKPPSSTPASSISSSSAEKSTSGFGSAFGSGATSGFGGLASGSVFGSGLKNGFAGGSGPKLSSFAAPGKDNAGLGSKPAKPFGAPASDAEDSDDDDDEDDSDDGAEGDEEEGGEKAIVEEKKKTKKVHIDDGEADEATILQIRAKLFAMGSKELGWKERGVGTVKINAPKSCVDFDESGHAIPGSFDSSMLEGKSVRLVMRQENTHRVILNTVVLKAMEFKPKPSTTSAQVLFTAFEGETEAKPVNMILKMNENNYKLFTNEIENIQHEL